MNNNDQNPDPLSGSGGGMPGQFSTVENIRALIARMGALTIVALLLVPVTAFLVYAVYSKSQDAKFSEATAAIETAIEAYGGGEVDESLGILMEVRTGFAGTKPAKVAEYYEGAILFSIEDDEKALERMESLLSSSPDELLRNETLFMAGFSNFRLKRWDEAIAYFEKLARSANVSYQKRVLPLLGTAYMKKGEKVKAEAVYKRFVTAFPKANIIGNETEDSN